VKSATLREIITLSIYMTGRELRVGDVKKYKKIRRRELIPGVEYYIIYDDYLDGQSGEIGELAKRIKIIDIENGEISYNHSDDQAQVRAIHIGNWPFDTFSTTIIKRKSSRRSGTIGGTKRPRNKKSRKRI
jgi:hypothetical protein